ncbi:MAG: mannitol dehydrogenase family protein [Bacteroidota bacterium]
MDQIQLSQKALPRISEQIPCPNYDRTSLTSGIIHIGVGGFHRAHQAFYLHQLLKKNNDLDWGILGVGLRKGDRKMFEILNRQDFLYTLIQQHPDGTMESEVMGAMTGMLLAENATESIIDRLAHPETKIVSLTITEGGYNIHPHTGAFNFEDADIQHELQHPYQPRTIFGFLTAGLRKRQMAGLPAFTVLSCDNIQHNGDVARKMLLAFVQRQDPDLAGWIEEAVCFPNSMVDRITPVTTEADVAYLQDTHALTDEWPVICEPFIQWVVEDRFSNGRPALEEVGVQFVPDVTPYEKMKIRLLNAGHSVLGIPGAIHGHASINACMDDPVFARFMRKFMDEEATPVLDPIEGIDLTAYKDSLEARFANPNIKDHVSRICSESSAKLPKFLLPTLQENLAEGGSIQYASFILAAWCYYSDQEMDEQQRPLEIIDAQKQALHDAARHTSEDPLRFLRLAEIFGSLHENDRFTRTYTDMVQAIYASQDIRKLMAEMV